MAEQLDEDPQKEYFANERKRLIAKEREITQRFAQQEREMEGYRTRLREEQLTRDKQHQKELEAREKLFREREQTLINRQQGFEKDLMQRQGEIEHLRDRLQSEIASREARLQEEYSQLQQEKDRYNEESRKRIEKTSKDYVSEALERLDKKEKLFHRISVTWSVLGAGALIAGLAFFVYITLSSALFMPSPITWEHIVFLIVKGLVAIGLLAALAKYAFLFSSSYIREALKNADRRHAINFGKFYLESYGAAADWAQVKEAFEHWNITGSNAFSPQKEVETDVATLEKAATIFERVSKALPNLKTNDS